METFNKVLLIDDDDIVNSINSIIIKHARFANQVESVNSVSTALDFLNRAKGNNEVPEVIFLDLNMPNLDGWDFMDEYQKLGLNDATKVVMLTSSISSKDEERAYSFQQIVAFISKPLSPELLESIYQSHLVES